MAISCSRSLSSSTSRTLGFSPLIVFTFISSKKPSDFPRTSLRGVGQRTRRTARQRYAKVAAVATAHYGNLSAVGLYQLARNRQAEAAALDAAFPAVVGLGPAAEEQVEDRLALLRRHARPAVHHFDHRFAGEQACAHRDGTARRRELHRVGNQVVDDRAQLLRIGFERRRLRLDRQAQ